MDTTLRQFHILRRWLMAAAADGESQFEATQQEATQQEFPFGATQRPSEQQESQPANDVWGR